MDTMNMGMALPGWLTPVSWVFVALGAVSAAAVLYDIYGRRHRQSYAAMNVVWPVSALYLGPFGVWAYRRWGAPRSHSREDHAFSGGDNRPGRALAGSTPGGAAATIGHFIGVPIVVASGLTIAGTDLWVMIILIALLAVVLLFVFEYFLPGSAAPSLASASASASASTLTRANAGVALLTAAVTVLAFDIGMGGWMLLLHYGNFMPAPTDISFIFLMQIGLILGTLTAYPVVRALLRQRVAVAV